MRIENRILTTAPAGGMMGVAKKLIRFHGTTRKPQAATCGFHFGLFADSVSV
jgi:hypothetical protein